MIPARHRIFTFVVFCLLVVVAVSVYAVHSSRQTRELDAASAKLPRVKVDQAGPLQSSAHLVFRSSALGPGYGCLSLVPLDDPGQPRAVTDLPCDRVYATPAGGMALQATRGVFTAYKAVAFDPQFVVGSSFRLAGVPSRTRLSRDGYRAASTVFVSGDSYNSAGFSTRTVIYDLEAGTIAGDLEEFLVERDGKPFKKIDFNFWGVTFLSDRDQFFATLGTGGEFYLVKGSVPERRITVMRSEVECPSLSPDGARVAYKWRTKIDGRLVWRVRVLDLGTDEVITLNEDRSVDDQVEWLDADRILYTLPRNVAGSGSSDIWVARLDGSEAPALFLEDASSPSVVRP